MKKIVTASNPVSITAFNKDELDKIVKTLKGYGLDVMTSENKAPAKQDLDKARGIPHASYIGTIIAQYRVPNFNFNGITLTTEVRAGVYDTKCVVEMKGFDSYAKGKPEQLLKNLSNAIDAVSKAEKFLRSYV